MSGQEGEVSRRGFLKLAGGLGTAALGTFPAMTLLSGCSKKSSTTALKVGVLAPFSDTKSSIGSVVNQSLTTAVKQMNSTGGVGGRKIELLFRDTGTDPSASERLYDELSGVPDTIGVLWCGAPGLDRALPRIAASGLPVMVVFSDLFSANALYPTNAAARSLFQLSLPDVLAKKALAAYAKDDRGYSSASLLSDSKLDPAGQGGSRVQDVFTSAGIRLTGVEMFATGDDDMTAQLERLKAGKPQVLYIEGISTDAATVAKALADMGAGYVDAPTAKGPDWHPQLFGALRDLNQVSAQLAGDALPVGSVTAWHLGGLTFLPGYALTGWMQKYLGKNPVGGEEGPADALATLVHALKKSGSTDRRRLVDAVETMGPVQFSSVPFSFAKDRHNALSEDDVVVLAIERLRGPAPTEPPYGLGTEWQGGQAYANQPAAPTLLVRPTLTANRRAHSGLMDEIMRQGYGTQCTKLADGRLSPACKIH